ncbi:hypothetical protein [Streptomyces ipomoeae]|uniref:hypothetical protein n=1 Tax=Streptomyces ipomoeae TaxID=103232 RepID=UPI0015F0432E|nr:hypothetical protein [Streptomyces ipomoeae]MDX2938885.1 hypothetical protein [Streptomyces ipomoeae]
MTDHTTDHATGHMTGHIINAAGCVLWRRSPAGEDVEICLVHRPKYNESCDR